MRDPEQWCIETANRLEGLAIICGENVPRCTGHPRELLQELQVVFKDFAAGLREVAASLSPDTYVNESATVEIPESPDPDQPEPND